MNKKVSTFILQEANIESILSQYNDQTSTTTTPDSDSTKKGVTNANEEEVGTKETITVTSQVKDPITGQIPPEQPEVDNPSLLPYTDKIQKIILLFKEFGYSLFDFKIENGKSIMYINGMVQNDKIKIVKDIAKQLDITVNIEQIKIDEDTTKTKINFENNLDANKFDDVYKILLRKEKEKQQASMGLGMI
jgi:predicted transcriptional regulator